ncbi:lebercilin-like protein [Ctenocephalides felis]|uniref:lebercilin-like protein n=1 Tax=Ctenocephalides felis TaxID=7515 RepID=UPI000E6E3F6B|nr:lebercilin-like protein [Ctenocephalides felis]
MSSNDNSFEVTNSKHELPQSSQHSLSVYKNVSLKTGKKPKKHAGFVNINYNHCDVTEKIFMDQKLKIKMLHNKLGAAQIHINELTNENRLLKQLQSKQDTVLSRLENCKSKLPQLLRNQDEDMRSCQNKYHHMRKELRGVAHKLKQTEKKLCSLQEAYVRLQILSEDRNLPERQQLMEENMKLQDDIAKQRDANVQLEKSMQLLSKNSKVQMMNENSKHKETKKALEIAENEVARLLQVLESRDKYIAMHHIRSGTRSLGNKIKDVTPKISVIKEAPKKIVRNKTSSTKVDDAKRSGKVSNTLVDRADILKSIKAGVDSISLEITQSNDSSNFLDPDEYDTSSIEDMTSSNQEENRDTPLVQDDDKDFLVFTRTRPGMFSN